MVISARNLITNSRTASLKRYPFGAIAGLARDYPYRVASPVVEKRTPHYDLARVQADVARLGAAAFTKTALDGGRMMGLTTAEMLAVIAALSRRQFHKS